MAASFKVGQEVKVKIPVPQGLVSALSVSQEGDIQYLVSWTDANGVSQERWFSEDDLVEV
jgi:uncharacterized protein YodC (DUF2158 family)